MPDPKAPTLEQVKSAEREVLRAIDNCIRNVDALELRLVVRRIFAGLTALFSAPTEGADVGKPWKPPKTRLVGRHSELVRDETGRVMRYDEPEPSPPSAAAGREGECCPKCGAERVPCHPFWGTEFACSSGLSPKGEFKYYCLNKNDCLLRQLAAKDAELAALREKLAEAEKYKAAWGKLGARLTELWDDPAWHPMFRNGVSQALSIMSTLITPTAPEAEATPERQERPARLYAREEGQPCHVWWVRSEDGPMWRANERINGVYAEAASWRIASVHRERSDARALELYDADMQRGEQ